MAGRIINCRNFFVGQQTGPETVTCRTYFDPSVFRPLVSCNRRTGCRLFVCSGPAPIEVPEKAKAIEDAYRLHLIESRLDQAIGNGAINASDPKLVAAYLNALVEQTALYDLRTGNVSLDMLDREITALFASLKP